MFIEQSTEKKLKLSFMVKMTKIKRVLKFVNFWLNIFVNLLKEFTL